MENITSTKKLESFLIHLSVKHGYCLQRDYNDKLLSSPGYTAEEFANAVLLAEGMDPNLEVAAFRTIRNLFIERFGTEIKLNIEKYNNLFEE